MRLVPLRRVSAARAGDAKEPNGPAAQDGDAGGGGIGYHFSLPVTLQPKHIQCVCVEIQRFSADIAWNQNER